MTSRTSSADGEPSSRQIKADIDRTRAHMDHTFDALESKLTPGQIMQEGWDLLKGGSGAGAKKVFDIARQHPVPSAVIGLGLGLLLFDSNRKDRGDKAYDGRYASTGGNGRSGNGNGAYGRPAGNGVAGTARDAASRVADLAGEAKDKVSGLTGQAAEKVGGLAGQAKEKVSDLASQTADKVSDLASTVRDQASELGERVGRGTRRARLGFWQLMEERPLAVGAAALAVGLLAGLAVPATDTEDDLMGETRDQLLDRAQDGAREALDRGKHVADAAVDAVKRVAQEEGLTPDNLADKVKHVAQQATETVKNEAVNQKLVPPVEVHAEPELAKR